MIDSLKYLNRVCDKTQFRYSVAVKKFKTFLMSYDLKHKRFQSYFQFTLVWRVKKI